jgi:hypothetical protein
VFRNYLNEHEVFREVMIDVVNEALDLEMPITILNRGKSVGEVLDSLIHLIIGIRYWALHNALKFQG